MYIHIHDDDSGMHLCCGISLYMLTNYVLDCVQKLLMFHFAGFIPILKGGFVTVIKFVKFS